MSQWKIVLLVVLAFIAGTAIGYLNWGTTAARLGQEVRALQENLERARRQVDARDAGAAAGNQLWEGRGVVRAAYPQLLMITHEEIPGLQPARTTAFRVADGIEARVGDAIRFWIEGTASHNSVLTRIASFDERD